MPANRFVGWSHRHHPAWDAVKEKDREVNAADAEAEAEGAVILADDVQERIADVWEHLAGKRGRIRGSKAGGAAHGAVRFASMPSSRGGPAGSGIRPRSSGRRR